MDSHGISVGSHLGLRHGESERSKGHQGISHSSYNHTVCYLSGSRWFFALCSQSTKDSHRHRGEGYHIEGVELLEDRSGNCHNLLAIILKEEESQSSSYHDEGNHLTLTCLRLEQGEECIDDKDHSHQIPNIKAHGLNAGSTVGCKLIGKIGQRESVLVESHPEEDDHGKHQAECHDALFGLLFGEFLNRCSFSSFSLLTATLCMTERATENVVDSDRKNQRCTSHSEREVIGIIAGIA